MIGNVGWRQNEQTYDAARLSTKALENFDFQYIYIDRVLRIFGHYAEGATRNFAGDTHLLHVDWKGPEDLKLAGYVYLMDFDRTGQRFSNNTYGMIPKNRSISRQAAGRSTCAASSPTKPTPPRPPLTTTHSTATCSPPQNSTTATPSGSAMNTSAPTPAATNSPARRPASRSAPRWPPPTHSTASQTPCSARGSAAPREASATSTPPTRPCCPPISNSSSPCTGSATTP